MQLHAVAGACALRRCGGTTPYHLVRRGQLRVTKVGKLTRFRRREHERLIDRSARAA
jgi:excisionase family DNA binding protein